ncbi:MAG: hypothetical protein QOF98_2562 [Streptomyces sp.]|nr:hypothetical protein [Streptomyces sp.]
MTFTEAGIEPSAAAPGPTQFARAFVFSAVAGGMLASLVVGTVIESVPLFAVGLGLFAVVVVSMAVMGRSKPAGLGAERRTALALIESRRATGGESADIPVEFVLTVAPDDRAAYRVKTNESINLLDIPDYPPRRVLVVEYRAERPWDVTIVKEPTPEWARRAAEGAVDSAPESTLLTRPKSAVASCWWGIAGLLVGAAVVVALFRADLFDSDASATSAKPGAAPTSSVSSSFSSSSVTMTVGATSYSATYTLPEPGEPMLRAGQMRTAAESLTTQTGTSDVARLTIGARTMEVEGGLVLTTDGVELDPLIDLRAVPYERLPALVGDAGTTLGIADPTSWRITFGHDTAGPDATALVIHVSVSDDQGAASLTADAQGRVTKRSPRSAS